MSFNFGKYHGRNASQSDPISEASSNCCHKSDVYSCLEERLVLSAKIAILQLTSSGSSLMYSKKSVGPRMKLSGTPALVRYSYEG